MRHMGRFSSLIVNSLRMRSETARIIDRVLESVGRQRRLYSSKDQDRWAIQRVFREAREGYFVEVGAGDGRTHSNTFALERDYGWTGILIEANPAYLDAMQRYRKCHCINACVNDNEVECDFFCFGHLGGVIADDTDNSWKKRKGLLRSKLNCVVKLKCMTLEEVLDAAHAPPTIEYLSVDVEGAEFRVLKGFPFHRYAFEAMTIERPTKKVHALLTEAGYVLDRLFRHDGFYVSKKRAAIIGAKGIPFEGMSEKPF